VERVGHVVKGQERQVAAGNAVGHPLHLPLLLPAGAPPEAPEQEGQGRDREDDEVGQLQPFEHLDPRFGHPAGEPAAPRQHLVELKGEQGRRRQVQERRQPPEAPGARQRGGEHQEEVERHRRQQDVGDRVEERDHAERRVPRRSGGEQVEGRRGQAPEIEQEALAAAVP
jgi:hypothetical protein